MSNFLISSREPSNVAEFERTMQHIFAEIQIANQDIEKQQNRIIRLKSETDLLREETIRLKSEIRSSLSRMGVSL